VGSVKKFASVLGVLTLALFMAACSYQSQIDQSTTAAQGSAQTAATEATDAQNSANKAAEAAKRAEEASAGAQDSVHRANDAVARLEALFSTSVMK
jgi:hypothetical protein